MNVYGRSRFKWKANDLFFRDEIVISVIPAEDDLWWLKWPDGKISADYYNKTRAREHAVRLAMKIINGVEEAEQDV